MVQQYSPDGWQRYGRGRTFQFFATDAEIVDCLTSALPANLAPYLVVGSDSVKTGREWRTSPFQFAPSDLHRNCNGLGGRRWSFSICSLALTPGVEALLHGRIDANCAVNGLVNLQQGGTLRTTWLGEVGAESSLGIVDRIVNTATGEQKTHDGYVAIFSAMRRWLERRLCYSSIRLFPDGKELEDTRVRMTAGVVQAYEAGGRYLCRPGRLLR